MTIEHQKTAEERALQQLVDEGGEALSEAGRTVLGQALDISFKAFFGQACGRMYMPEEYEGDMEEMRRAAAELAEDDFVGLAKIWRSALAAAASVDPYDFETLAGHRVYAGDLHRCYRLLSSRLEEVRDAERKKRFEELRKQEPAEREPMDAEDPPF
jgi:hypothetical protein